MSPRHAMVTIVGPELEMDRSIQTLIRVLRLASRLTRVTVAWIQFGYGDLGCKFSINSSNTFLIRNSDSVDYDLRRIIDQAAIAIKKFSANLTAVKELWVLGLAEYHAKGLLT